MIHSSATIYDQARIVGNRENFSLGAHSQIDDFVFCYTGARCEIGRNVHISSFCSIIGGGELVMEDFSGLSAGCRLITGSDDFTGPWLTNPTVPAEFTHVLRGKIRICRHAVLGTNAVVYPGVTIGEGAAVGAGCLVRKDLEPWTIYAGTNPKPVGKRDAEAILAKEKAYLESESVG
ncbi:acyltransferase [Kiritimatiellaeota bacterium B1221]|nr:acyltransferase [Kiritimatiellaeota bacterium B1221]